MTPMEHFELCSAIRNGGLKSRVQASVFLGFLRHNSYFKPKLNTLLFTPNNTVPVRHISFDDVLFSTSVHVTS